MNIQAQSILKLGNRLELGRAASLAPSVVAIAASVLIILFVVWPKFSQVLRLRTSNEQLETRTNALAAKAQVLQNLDRDLLEQQLASAEQMLPSDKGVFALLSQIERAAASSGIILSGLDVAPGVIDSSEPEKSASSTSTGATPSQSDGKSSREESPKIQVKLGASSDYRSFLQFMTNMFSVSRVIAIKDLSVGAGSGESSQVKTSFTIEAFWQSLPAQLPSIETPIEQLTDSESAQLEKVRSTGFVVEPLYVAPSVPLGKADIFEPF